ncbi:Hypp8258 [Branchiostoma lanceolatum]|uniref:Hypp8258 protein n=1 Tax=Branchiostoma lanceolatum TaxID=7740 RepID=A0A8K0EF47_BRALA|nr:Hypp8258 [Branchiostoma lanceolatum]
MMEPAMFYMLEDLTPRIQKKAAYIPLRQGGHHFAIFGHWGVEYESLAYVFSVASNTLVSVVPEVCQDIHDHQHDTVLKYPTTEWKEVAQDFSDKWPFHHCCFVVCLGTLWRKQEKTTLPQDTEQSMSSHNRSAGDKYVKGPCKRRGEKKAVPTEDDLTEQQGTRPKKRSKQHGGKTLKLGDEVELLMEDIVVGRGILVMPEVRDIIRDQVEEAKAMGISAVSLLDATESEAKDIEQGKNQLVFGIPELWVETERWGDMFLLVVQPPWGHKTVLFSSSRKKELVSSFLSLNTTIRSLKDRILSFTNVHKTTPAFDGTQAGTCLSRQLSRPPWRTPLVTQTPALDGTSRDMFGSSTSEPTAVVPLAHTASDSDISMVWDTSRDMFESLSAE